MFRGLKKDRVTSPEAAAPPAPPITAGAGSASGTDPARAMRREQERTVRHAQRDFDRELSKLKQDEMKAKEEIKRLATAGRTADAAQVAKLIAQNRKYQEQAQRGKVQASAIGYQASQALVQQKMVGVMADTANMMAQANAASNPENMMRTAQEYGLQMDKMAMTQEMTDDVLESAFGGVGVDTEADRILDEVLAQAGMEVRSKVGGTPQIHPVQPQQATSAPVEQAEDDAEFQRRFAALGP